MDDSNNSINSSEDTFAIEDESALYEIECQKDFFLFFKRSYNLVITDFRIVMMYPGYSLEKGNDNSKNIKR